MPTTTEPMIELKRGDTWIQTFEWLYSSNNLPVDLNGCIADLDLVSLRTGSRVLMISSTESPSSLSIDGSNGIVNLRVEADDMAILEPGQYKSDLQLTFSDGTVRSTNTFYIRILEDVTFRQ